MMMYLHENGPLRCCYGVDKNAVQDIKAEDGGGEQSFVVHKRMSSTARNDITKIVRPDNSSKIRAEHSSRGSYRQQRTKQ